MSKFIARRGENKVSKSDILLIASKAKKDQAEGNKIINASIGVFLNDDKTLNGVLPIKESLTKHIVDDLSYPSVLGPKEYKEAVLTWLLKDRLEGVVSNYYVPFGSTLGGTGACYIAFGTFLEEGDKVILPDPMWDNYKQIALKCGIGHQEYSLVDEKGNFNLESLKKTIEEVSKTQKHILVVINDPCQNPTGYCLKDEEYEKLFKYLQEEGKKEELTVLFDIAYIDYMTYGKKSYQVFDYVTRNENSFLPCFAFSCSKSFGVYGLRCGALFAFTKDEEVSGEILSSIGSYARGIYSCPNGPALHSVALALKDEWVKSELVSEIADNSDLLRKRGKLFISLLNENGISYYPYSFGFFVTIIVDDAFKLTDELTSIHSYVVPLDETRIRIALSGLNEEEMIELVKQIKEHM
ncbi:MAG: pyridoxal phosphate-dependent aminotransferase [Bacilli bacterium]